MVTVPPPESLCHPDGATWLCDSTATLHLGLKRSRRESATEGISSEDTQGTNTWEEPGTGLAGEGFLSPSNDF